MKRRERLRVLNTDTERERDLLHIGLSSRQMMNLAADWLVKEGGELLRPANGPSCG